MKAILFTSHGVWDDYSKWVEICEDDEVVATIAKVKRLCSEIIDTEVFDVYKG